MIFIHVLIYYCIKLFEGPDSQFPGQLPRNEEPGISLQSQRLLYFFTTNVVIDLLFYDTCRKLAL